MTVSHDTAGLWRARVLRFMMPWPMAIAVCFAAGSLSALAMPPWGVWPVLFITLPALYVGITQAKTLRGAFIRGWVFGFGYFLFSLMWIGNALLVEGNPYKWALPLAVSGLPALLAFFHAFACCIYKRVYSAYTLGGVLGFVAVFCGFEWLRGHLFTGFPWNLFGYTWAELLPMLQILSISDVYFLTFLTCIWAIFPTALFFQSQKERRILVLMALISMSGCFGFGLWRLQSPALKHDDAVVKIVQPNIPQAEKWQRDKMQGHFENMLALSRYDGSSEIPTIIVWPETALSYRILNERSNMQLIQDMLEGYPAGATLISGALLRDEANNNYANAMIRIQDDGSITNVYNKHHLVPFGEYIPFQDWIPLDPVVAFKGFERGEGLKTYNVTDRLTYSPLICYEIIFSGRSIAPNSRPSMIVNVTNDGWYGKSAGPYQHFTMAAYRAIETGVPVIRSANTGLSGMIDAYGHVSERTELFTADVKTVDLAVALPRNYATAGVSHLLFPIFLLLCAIAELRCRRSLQT